jgi:hypothetical protein
MALPMAMNLVELMELDVLRYREVLEITLTGYTLMDHQGGKVR